MFGPECFLLGIEDLTNGFEIPVVGVSVAKGNTIQIGHSLGKNGASCLVAKNGIGHIESRRNTTMNGLTFVNHLGEDNLVEGLGIGRPPLAEEGKRAREFVTDEIAVVGEIHEWLKSSSVDLLNAIG